MSLSAQLTSEQLKKMIQDEKYTDTSPKHFKEQIENGETGLNPERTSSVANTVLITINIE
jgi:hypothetical protein